VRECTVFAVLAGGGYAGVYGFSCFGRRRGCGSVRLSLFWPAAGMREYTALVVLAGGNDGGMVHVSIKASCIQSKEAIFPPSPHRC